MPALLATHYGNVAKAEGVDAEDEALKLIARAAEGSVRDGLSLLDQAIAHGNGKVLAADVTDMLGLVDRSKVIDLFAAVMAGDGAKAIALVQEQFAGGAGAATVLADLSDFVQWVTRLRLAKDEALKDTSRTEVERARGVEFAASLAMPACRGPGPLLLKGIAEERKRRPIRNRRRNGPGAPHPRS
ncbi:MAG: hypothetical protein U1E15_05940 [Hyphomicrobiales bacterium]